MEKKKLKICFLSGYSSSVNRGVERWVQELGNRLVEKGHLVKVYQLGSNSNQNYEEEQVFLKVNWKQKDTSQSWLRLFGLDYWSRILKQFTLKALSDITNFVPDIIIPLNGGNQNYLVKGYCRKTGTKMVLVGHWNDLLGLRQKPDLYIATSAKQENWARKIYRGKIVKILNGVNLKEFNLKGKKYPIKVPHPTILTVGALIKGKNIDATIKAVSQIPKIGLVVCGDGDLKEKYLNLGKKLMGNRFQLLSLKSEDMPALYRTCDLFTLVPDQTEAFGLVFLEAMACGLGVVTIDDGTRREIIGQAGLLVKKNSGKEYVSALKKTLNVDFTKNARKQAEKYSWEQIVDEYEKSFLNLFKENM